MNGATDLLNKVDILEQVDQWNAYVGQSPEGSSMTFQNKEQFCDYIQHYFKDINVVFSDNPERI